MSIRCQCTGCGGRFEAPDELAGKAVRCPKCKAAIRVPDGKPGGGDSNPVATKKRDTAAESTRAGGASEGIAWFFRDTDGQHHGPMSKTELDRLAADGRLDGLCQVRRADWEGWRWIETVYPQFAEREAGAPPLGRMVKPDRPAAAAQPRLLECPDCGKIVSRRATQCPNCGCPVAAVARIQPSKVAADDANDEYQSTRKGGKRKIFVLTVLLCMLLSLLGGSAWVGWQLWKLSHQPAEILAPLLAPPPAPLPQPAAPQPAAPEQIAAWIDAAAAETARGLDNGYHQLYLAQTGIQAMQEQSDLIQSLVSGEFAKPAKHDKDQPKPQPPPPYQSQYEPLRQECADYLRKNVDAKTADRAAIVELARRWAEAKRSPLQKALEGQIGVGGGQ